MSRLTHFAVAAMLAAPFAAPAADVPISTEAWWAVPGADGVQRVYIECGTDYFNPRQIVVRAYAPVELHVRTTSNGAGEAFVMSYPGASVRQALNGKPAKVLFHAGAVMQAPLECLGPPQQPQLKNARRGLITVLP